LNQPLGIQDKTCYYIVNLAHILLPLQMKSVVIGLFAGKRCYWLLCAGFFFGIASFAQTPAHPADGNLDKNDVIRPLNNIGRYALPGYQFSPSYNFPFQPANRNPDPNTSNFSDLDTFATYTYRLKIGNPGSVETVHHIRTISSGNMLLAGKTLIAGDQQTLFIKLNSDGRLVWSKT